MILTKLEAKERTVKFWTYAKEHPEIEHKKDFPPEIYDFVGGLLFNCPLCEVSLGDCSDCPLFLSGESCEEYNDSPFNKWCCADRTTAEGLAQAAEAAGRIAEIAEAWEAKE
jgi:hypothetical protein